MFPGFPGRYVIKREPLKCITRLRSRVTNSRQSYAHTEERRGGPGFWLWIALRREAVPDELDAIIRGVNRELRAGAPLVKCPGAMALRDWLEEHEPDVVAGYDGIVADMGRSRPDCPAKKTAE